MSESSILATGCYSTAGRGTGVELLELTPDGSGRLLARAACPDPSFVIWSPDGELLYAVCETSPTRVLALRPDEDTVALEIVGQVTLHGSGGCHLALGPDRRSLIVAEYGSGHVETVRLDERGLPTEVIHRIDHAELAPGSTPHPHQVQLLPGGDLIAVSDLGLDRVILYRAEGDGHLVHVDGFGLRPGSGPRHMAPTSDGTQMYLACELSGQVASADRISEPGPAPGAGSHTWEVDSYVPASAVSDTGGKTAPVPDALSQIELTPDERYLLVGNRGPDTVSVLAVDREPGGAPPRLLEEHEVGEHPRHFTQHREWVLVAAQEADRIDVLRLHDGHLDVGAPPIFSGSVSCIAPRP